MSQDTANTTKFAKSLLLPDSLLNTTNWKATLFGDSGYLEEEAEQGYPSDPEYYTEQGLNAKELLLGISKSIVSVVSFVGNFTNFHLYKLYVFSY
jgi:hypothetical protein